MGVVLFESGLVGMGFGWVGTLLECGLVSMGLGWIVFE